MSNERGLWQGIASELESSVRQGALQRLNEEFTGGFDEAAHISVGILTEQIDALLARIQAGQYLTDEEQFLLSHLNSVRDETERRLRAFWEEAQ